MLLCVFLVWPTKFENSLNLMQNMFNVWEFKENWLKILILGKLGFIHVFFEKHFISYSCILFLKFNALRSFYIKLLCFSKLCFFFPEFQTIKPIFWSIEIAIKILVSLCLFRSVLNCLWINWSIFDRSNLFFDQLKITMRVF